MDQITPRSIPLLRLVNNDYLADAFFYLAAERGESIVRHVTQTFNASFQNFLNLGGIIAWDILSHQAHSGLSLAERQKRSKLLIDFPTLDFKPDYLFNLGSPLSAFLIIRNQDPKQYHPDPSIHFENIVHPLDPLGYRLEPLLNPEAQDIPAVVVERSLDSFLSPFTHHGLWHTGRRWLHSLLCPKEERGKRKTRDWAASEPGSKRSVHRPDTSTLTRASQRTEPDLSCIAWPRIDYVLPQPDTFLGSFSYLSGITAHFSYWTHIDLLWHVVRRLETIKP
ncbi:DDHD domain-containing protein [Sporodiniella umbellata]|nr:DDHD domain-containing protein [Sporodiniella umbellata]